MGDVVPFKKRKLSEKHDKRGLCRSGFHKWEVMQGRRFDVKSGKLITAYRCARCGAEKNEAR